MILAIESSQEFCSVALHGRDGEVFSLVEKELRSAAARLMPMVDELLKQHTISSENLGAIAVSSGPGSYTGLRVGFSTAKGLAMALGKPLIAIPTLEILAGVMRKMAENIDAAFIPLLDARRMEVFWGSYEADGNELMGARADIIQPGFEKILPEANHYIFGGSGADKFAKWLSETNVFSFNQITIMQAPIQPSAADMGELAWKAFDHNNFADLAYSVPLYGKEFWSEGR